MARAATKLTGKPKAETLTASKSAGRPSTSHLVDDLAIKVRGVVNSVSSAIMLVDDDLIITYVNDASKRLFHDNLDEFRKVWPNFDPNALIGTCIDIFHRNPAHQRRLLANPANLPFNTDIPVGPLKISLLVNPTHNAKGEPEGFSLEWADVTAARTQTSQLAAIDRSQ